METKETLTQSPAVLLDSTPAVERPPVPQKLPKFKDVKRFLKFGKKAALMALHIWGVYRTKTPPGPIFAQIGIIDPCNHKCVMCADHPPEENISPTTEAAFALPPGNMSMEEFKTIVDDLKSMDTQCIELVGQGEPTLHHKVTEMLQYAKSKDMVVRMVSNGSRIFKDLAEAMVDTGMEHLQISMNAGKPETYPKIHVTESPENYLKVKANLKYLHDYKKKRGSKFPYVRLSFVISKDNCFELKEMVQATHDVGAEEATFVYASVHEGTQNIKLTEEEFRKVKASIPEAMDLAKKLGVEAGLKIFAASQPPYMENEIMGPPVVPCYIGWYFTRVIGNGSILPCCQCPNPLGEMKDVGRWKNLWGSDIYNRFRQAAKALPEKNDILNNCECNQCTARPRNILIHNLLYPFNRIKGIQGDLLWRFKDIFKSRRTRV